MTDMRKTLDDLEGAAFRAWQGACGRDRELAQELQDIFNRIERLVDEYERETAP